jgi:hypothetical protein
MLVLQGCRYLLVRAPENPMVEALGNEKRDEKAAGSECFGKIHKSVDVALCWEWNYHHVWTMQTRRVRHCNGPYLD